MLTLELLMLGFGGFLLIAVARIWTLVVPCLSRLRRSHRHFASVVHDYLPFDQRASGQLECLDEEARYALPADLQGARVTFSDYHLSMADSHVPPLDRPPISAWQPPNQIREHTSRSSLRASLPSHHQPSACFVAPPGYGERAEVTG